MEKNNKHLDKVRWAARRGMLELDLILMPYVENDYLNASDEERECFLELLKCEDQDLFAWFLRSKIPDQSFQQIVDKVLSTKNI